MSTADLNFPLLKKRRALLLLLAPSKEEPPGILANNNFLPLLALALPLALFQVRAAELPHGLVGFL